MHITQIVEDCDRCIGEDAEELLEMVLQVFPTPTQMESDKGVDDDNGQQPEAS